MIGGPAADRRGGNEMKKYFAVLLALCMVLGLCACGGSSSSAPAAPAAEAPAASIAGSLGAKDGGSELTVVAKGSATACVGVDVAVLPKPEAFAISRIGSSVRISRFPSSSNSSIGNSVTQRNL